MNSLIDFIVKDLLGQASILVAFIAMLGLLLQKKSIGKVAEGTFKTLLGFLIMMAGINIIVGALTYLNSIFTQGFGMTGYITDVAAIAGLANRELGSEVALTLMVIFAVNIIIARITPFKYIFLTGQALLWMATIGAVIGYKAGLTGMPLILTGGIFGGVMAVLMPALAQPVVRKITGSDDVALGHFCTIGYLVQAAVAKVVGKGSRSTEDLELPGAIPLRPQRGDRRLPRHHPWLNHRHDRFPNVRSGDDPARSADQLLRRRHRWHLR